MNNIIEKAVRVIENLIQHHMLLDFETTWFNAGTSKVTVYRPLLTKRMRNIRCKKCD